MAQVSEEEIRSSKALELAKQKRLGLSGAANAQTQTLLKETQAKLAAAEADKKIAADQGLARERDISKGREIGRDILGEEGLGRLGTDADVQGVLKRYKDISEKGLDTPEGLARKEKAQEGIGRATATAESALLARLGSRGVRGASAGKQLADVQIGGLRQRAELERDVFLESEQLKRSGLKDFAQALGQVKTFDLGQASREKDIELSAGFGYGQIGQAERSSIVQAEAMRQSAIMQAQSSGK